jgi:hypothetical protein
MEVLQHQHHRGPFRAADQHGPHRVEHLQLVQVVARGPAHEPGRVDPGQEPAQSGRGRRRPGQQLGLLRVVGEPAQGVHHREISQADVAQLHAASAEHPHPAAPGPLAKCQQQPGLAHPGVAGDQHDLGPALLGPVQRRLELAQLDGPADERRARGLPSHARQYGRRPRESERIRKPKADPPGPGWGH